MFSVPIIKKKHMTNLCLFKLVLLACILQTDSGEYKESKPQKGIRHKQKMASPDSSEPTASKIAAKLNLKPHPEGGFYSETFRDTSVNLSTSHLPPTYKVDRPISTCIYFLVPSGSVSHLHRIPMAETWHFYMGEPLTVVELNEADGKVKLTCLGPNPLEDGQQVQYTVPPNVWFGSFPTRDFNISADMQVTKAPTRDGDKHFSLVGCTCAPAFQFEDFELAKRPALVSCFPAHESLISLLTFAE